MKYIAWPEKTELENLKLRQKIENILWDSKNIYIQHFTIKMMYGTCMYVLLKPDTNSS